jgi:hypothetical protein
MKTIGVSEIFSSAVLAFLLFTTDAKAIDLLTAQEGLDEILTEYQNQGWPTSTNSFFVYDGNQYDYNGAVGNREGGFQPILVGAMLEGQEYPPTNDEYAIFTYDTAAFATKDEIKYQISYDFNLYFLLTGSPENVKIDDSMLMSIYPNPNNGNFFIVFKENIGALDLIIEAYNQKGQLIKKKKYFFTGNRPKPFTIEKGGIYIIKARNKQMVVTKVVEVAK